MSPNQTDPMVVSLFCETQTFHSWNFSESIMAPVPPRSRSRKRRFSVAGGRDVRSTDDDAEDVMCVDPSSPSPGRGVGLEKRRLNATLGQHGQRDEDGQVSSSSSPSLYSSQQPQTEGKKVSFAHERAARPIHS